MDLFSQAADLGIQTEFIDGQGRRRTTDAAALERGLGALPAQQPHPLTEGAVVLRPDQAKPTVAPRELNDAVRFPVRWEIVGASGILATGEADRNPVDWPSDLAEGVYRLCLSDAAASSDEVPLVVAPARAFKGDFDRCWLLAVQLYGVRSRRNWGMGDFTDLANLIELAAGMGADGIGLNPLHALFDDHPGDCSPYSPNSRLFLNPLYIDVERLEEFNPADLGLDLEKTLPGLRQADIVNYVAVAELKCRALRSAFHRFSDAASPARRQDFEDFRRERGTLLTRFACFEALRRQFNRPWWEWPAEWQEANDCQCDTLRMGPAATEIEFVEFVQWNADRQLRACQDLARRLGMKVGLYLDVAVGVQSTGFDAWNEQRAISRSLSVGAPPDPLNTAGQNWGLAGFNATGLEARLFEPFREMLKASMRHAGAIRLDHVLGLKRLYLVPHGFGPDNGVYVQMPFEALLAVTAQESVQHRCVVIGEDLGTVPEGFRERMADWGIWSYQVMMFERDDHGRFRSIDRYTPDALVTFNTHDLSTYAGWRSFSDLRTKRSLGIDPGESDDARWHALSMMTDALRHHGIGSHDIYAVVDFLARTPSRLMAVAMEDLLGVIDQPNIPGTIDEHPNWRQRLPVDLEELTSATDVVALKTAMRGRQTSASAD